MAPSRTGPPFARSLTPGARIDAGARQQVGHGEVVADPTVALGQGLVPTDLAVVVEAAAAHFVRRSGRELRAQVGSAEVFGDADALTRATTNLLSNADKYSPAGTPIGLEVGPGGVFVDDAGPGIPPDERAAVVERFYRRDEDGSKPGSGLGLSIVAGIVEQHGGRLVITDSPLGGARVGFVLPSRAETER